MCLEVVINCKKQEDGESRDVGVTWGLQTCTHTSTGILETLGITTVVICYLSLRYVRVENTLRVPGPDHVSKVYFISKANICVCVCVYF